MHRFFLASEHARGDTLILSGAEAHHAAHVLRLHAGDPVVVLNGCGDEFHCEVAVLSRHAVRLKVAEQKKHQARRCAVTLVQAIPKAKAMDFIIQKATELGAARIIPVQTERSEVHLDQSSAQAKVDKWLGTAIESIKQCGLVWLPEIAHPTTITDYLKEGANIELSVIASLKESTRTLKAVLRDFESQHQCPPRSIRVWIGPEGDFSLGELDLIEGSGSLPITLGPRILRAETAALYCLSAINYELEE